MNKYEWMTGESALENHPMRIIEGIFFDDEHNAVFMQPDRLIFSGLGDSGAAYLREDQAIAIPDRLQLTWFSYTENKFYHADFKLPFTELVRLFEKGFLCPDTREKIYYNRIMTGIWPKGKISLFMAGEGRVREVFFYQAKETEFNWEHFFDNTEVSRNDYIDSTLKSILQETVYLQWKDGNLMKDPAEKYRSTYLWKPELILPESAGLLSFEYYNGERNFFDYSNGQLPQAEQSPLPKKATLKWDYSQGNGLISFIDFDEAEIFGACEKLNVSDSPNTLRLLFELNVSARKVELFLAGDRQFISLKNTKLKTYRIP